MEWKPRFGPEIDASGTAFSVWAPNAENAWIEGDFADSPLPMEPVPGGAFQVHVDGAGAGARYRFVFDSPSGTITRLDPYCREVDGDHCLVVDPSAYAWKTPSFDRPDRASSVVYEMHVGSFAADGVSGLGTFASARAELPRLAELGVNVIELMPVTDFGGNPNGWGYNPHLYFAPKQAYGEADDLRALVDEAHSLGIAVWLDIVVNHYTGWKQAPLRCYDGLCDGDAGVHFFGDGPYENTPWGPRFSYPTPEVRDMLLDAARWWLIEERGDGFRWDSTSNIRAIDGEGETPGGKDLLVAANTLAHELGALSTAEDLKGWDALTKSAADGGFGFDAQWDGFCWAVTGELEKYADDSRDLNVVRGAVTSTFAGDGFARVLFTESHDTVGNGGARLPVKIDPADPESVAARRRSMLGAALLLTSPGVPMLFMGQEHLATTGFTDPPDPLPAPTSEGLGVLSFYKDMIALRRNLAGDSAGLVGAGVEVFHQNDAAKVIAYRRHGAPGQDVLVVVNLRNKAYVQYDIGVADTGPWRVRLDTNWKKYGADLSGGQEGTLSAFAAQKDGKPYTLPLKLGPYSAMIISH